MTREQGALMAETRLVVEHREQLWSLLVEAAQFEHMIMCQYLYACFSLKTEPDEGLTAEQADAVARWHETLTGIAIEEMLHLALVMNIMTAIGAAPTLARPNFPRHSEFLPPGVEFALLPFGADALTHFLYLERPEGMERVDATEFVPAAPPPQPAGQAEVMPRVQGFLTAGHLYRGIEQGLSDLTRQLGEPVLFVGEPRAQATPDRFRWPQLIAVRDLTSARAAIDEIIELLQLLTRFFTHTDETGEQLDALVHAALGTMAGVLKPLGTALTRLPMGPGHPGRTAGAAFQMYYQMGNFVPWRSAAWVLLSERAAVLSRQCAECATRDGVPEAVISAATTAATISEQLAGHLPQDLRPA
jgi:hypothetical protein